VEAGITGISSDKDYRLGVFGEYNFLTGTSRCCRGGAEISAPPFLLSMHDEEVGIHPMALAVFETHLDLTRTAMQAAPQKTN